MIRRARGPALAALLGALASAPLPAAGQELDVLELDDYIDPRDLAEVVEETGEPRFLASRLFVGVDNNYQFRDTFSGATAGLVHAVTALYVSHWQVNLKLTGFGADSRGDIPYFRARTQLARYLVSDGRNEAVRTQLSWTMDDRRGRKVQHEIAADVDFSFDIPRLHHGFTGGVIYAHNLSAGDHYLSFASRLPVIRWRNGSAVRLGVGIAREEDDFMELVRFQLPNIAKGEVSLEWVLPSTDSRIHAAYSPSFRAGREHWNHELSILLNAPLFATLF